jgi:hypothetical protein
MHLHGHNFWVMAQGTGEWNGTVTRPSNPQRRDTQLLERRALTEDGATYIVLDFMADNPGIWPFHCHVAWHVSDGLYVNIMVILPFVIPRQALMLAGATRFDHKGQTDSVYYGTNLQRLGRV